MKKMTSILFFIFVASAISFFIYYFFIAKAPVQKNITWGVNFSQMQAESLDLDWKKAYTAILEDLAAKNIKLLTNWDFVEEEKGNYYFKDIDWQVSQAESHGAKLIYVVGMKTGRWPECHLPNWAKSLSKEKQQDEILKYAREVILRYRKSSAIVAWQAENEPLFIFGKCPWYDSKFLKKEIDLIKSLDPSRPVIVSDSGEQSLWIKASKLGDIMGMTIYRKVRVKITNKYGFYFKFPIPAATYWRKAQIIKNLFNKEVINVELQAEPWVSEPLIEVPLSEQEKTMDLIQFRENVDYAKKTGAKEFYFWGTEWWYWLKEKYNKPEIWNEAKKLLKTSSY